MWDAQIQPTRLVRAPAPPALRPLLAPFLLLLSGCTQLAYEGVHLGQEQREYRTAFPEDQVRRTPTGSCYLERDPLGRTEAIVLLLTPDRRVAAKLRAVHTPPPAWLASGATYELHGEIDPQLLNLSATGPIDMLRAIADQLTTPGDDSFARDAQAWIAAGLVRLLQRWPSVTDEGPAITRLTEALGRVPGGGTAQVTIDPRGALLLHYLAATGTR